MLKKPVMLKKNNSPIESIDGRLFLRNCLDLIEKIFVLGI